MARVFVSIGSNVDRERYVSAALDALAENFGAIDVSSVYESEAVGFSGENFLNLVVGFDTVMVVAELSRCLRDIEAVNGRQRGEAKFSARTLDIDILTYDDCVGEVDGVMLPRAEILHNAFVLLPLAELAPDAVHPVEQKTYGALWRTYNKAQKLWAIDFRWRGQQISRAVAS